MRREPDASERLSLRLRADLSVAQRTRDPERTRLLRALIGALDSAGAVESGAGSGTGDPLGPPFGRTEAPRRRLDAAAVRALLEREIGERRTAAESYRAHGRAAEADRLDWECARIDEYRDEFPPADARE